MSKRLEKIKNLALHKYLGVKNILSTEGGAELFAVVNANTVNPAGNYHGGVLYTLCDVCAYSGLISQLSPEQDAVTHDIHVSVLRPALESDDVTYTSSIVKLGKTLCFIDVEAQVKGKTIATARVTKSIVSV